MSNPDPVQEYGAETLRQFLRFTELSGIEDTQANFDVLQATVRATYPNFRDKSKVITHDAYAAVYFSVKDKLTHVPAPVVEPIVQTVTIEKKSRAELAEEKFLRGEATRKTGLASQADRQEEATRKANEAKAILENIGKFKDAILNPPTSDNSEAVKQARKRLPINPEKITRQDAISWLKDPDLDAATIRQVYAAFPDVKRRIYEVTNA